MYILYNFIPNFQNKDMVWVMFKNSLQNIKIIHIMSLLWIYYLFFFISFTNVQIWFELNNFVLP